MSSRIVEVITPLIIPQQWVWIESEDPISCIPALSLQLCDYSAFDDK